MTATSGAASRRWSGSSALLLPTIAGLVFVSVCGGLSLSDLLGRVSALWVANAILVYFLLKHPNRRWPEILAAGLGANFLADVVMGDSLAVAVALTACNAAGILIIAAPLKHFDLHDEFSRPKPLCLFYALALGPAPIVSGLMSATFFTVTQGRHFLYQAIDWYATDALGYSIVVPMLMTVKLDALKKMFGRDQILVTLLLLGLVAGTLGLNFYARSYPIAFLIFPAVILVTFQRGFAGGALGVLMAAAYLMTPVLIGDARGALKAHSLREQIILVQVFIAVTGFSVILVGAALAERRRLEQGLAAAIVRAENAREEAIVARDVAERANRLKSMFLATMSHELRTPLNAIIGFSELMHGELYGPLGNGRYREYASLIEGAGRHLLSLINDVLDMSKIEAGKLELHRQVFDVREIVRDCSELIRDRADKHGIVLKEEIEAGPLRLDADKRAMKQILLNLLSNAIKFTPEGGGVTVRARREGGQLILSVADTGVGIPADQLSRLGNPFVQIRNSAGASHEGTGLGLALVRALAEVHDGRLAIESTLGKGSTVSVIIPALAERPVLARAS
ncbi:MAG TPA: ATP-binding protein [Rhizomicrobium sp.]|nr:ATP-binding protein [Rhizomicrobium sp.]